MKAWMMALVTASRALRTQTFTGNASFTVPPGVTSLATMTGHGSNGTAASTNARSAASVEVVYLTSGTGAGPVSNDWSNMQGAATSNLATVNAGGSVSYTKIDLTHYAGGTETLSGSTVNLSNVVAGSASNAYAGGWQSSGAITDSGSAIIAYTEATPAAPGAAATGFGQTLPGGAAGAAAPTTSLSNVTVTPGATYSIVVPAGGSLTIAYYQ